MADGSITVKPLRASRDYERLWSEGQTTRGSLVSVRWMDRADGPARVGLVVSRKIGGAVQRNKIKRQLRAALSESLAGGSLRAPKDVAIVAHPLIIGKEFHVVAASVRGALEEAGVLEPPGGGV